MYIAKVSKGRRRILERLPFIGPNLSCDNNISDNNNRSKASSLFPRSQIRFLLVIESSVLVVRTSHNGTKVIEDCGFLITPNIELLCHFPSAVGTHSMLPR